MIKQENLQILAELSQQMIDEAARLQNAVGKADSIEIERVKALILVLQKKIANIIGI